MQFFQVIALASVWMRLTNDYAPELKFFRQRPLRALAIVFVNG